MKGSKKSYRVGCTMLTALLAAFISSAQQNFISTRTIETVTKVDSKGDTIRTERVKTTSSNYRYRGNFERTPQGWLYHTATGHYDLKGKAHYWYVRDRLGSTVAVVDAAGNFLENNVVTARYDIYDFDQHNGSGFSTWLRNRLTEIGKAKAGEGKSFRIYFYGSVKLP